MSFPVLVVNESNLVMTIRCEASEPLTQTKGDTRSDARFSFTSFNTSSSKSRTKTNLCGMTRNNPIQCYRTYFKLSLQTKQYLFSP